jgi:hypothetical protein
LILDPVRAAYTPIKPSAALIVRLNEAILLIAREDESKNPASNVGVV